MGLRSLKRVETQSFPYFQEYKYILMIIFMIIFIELVF